MADVKKVRMADQQVKMCLGGKERTLYLDLNSFAELEKRFGNIQAAMASLTSGRIADVKVVLWAALIHEEVTSFDEETGEPLGYNITPYQVGKWVSPIKMPEVSEKLQLLMVKDLPEPDKVQLQQEMEKLDMALPQGVQVATVTLTEEEKKAQAEQERKN